MMTRLRNGMAGPRLRATAVLLVLFVLLALATTAGGYAPGAISLEAIGNYRTGVFDEGAAEIVAYDPLSQRLFSVNAAAATVDILDLSDPTTPTLIGAIDATPYGDGANSVAVFAGVVAVAVEADPKTDPGKVVFFDVDGNYLNDVTVGALPDMVTFTHNGRYLLVANEGEPNDDYTIDPEGSVSIIRMQSNVAAMTQANVRTADFTRFNDAPIDPQIRIFGPNATVAQDLEPEYITTQPANGRVAWVTLQENNALAVVDVKRAEVVTLVALGTKDHLAAANPLDASDRDDAINIANWPVRGMYQPDAIASYRAFGDIYLVTANEGDARDYDGFSEEERVEDLTLDATAFPNAATLQEQENLGRLTVTTTEGDANNDGAYEELYAFGARSFSIWDATGNLVYDSGDDFEQITADLLPADFNSDNDENDSFDSRSDAKGPEPEGVTVGRVNGRTYAFIGLERIGGIMVYDVTHPQAPQFVQYINTRDFSGNAEADTAGDLGPEGITFIEQRFSPIDAPLLVVGYEVSGSITVFRINTE